MEEDLKVRKVSVGWELLEGFRYYSEVTRRSYYIPPGFVTDFASVPRVPLAFLLTGDHAHYPAVVHDFLISYRKEDRAIADKIFMEAMKRTNEPTWRRWLMYAGVSLYTKWLKVKGVFSHG